MTYYLLVGLAGIILSSCLILFRKVFFISAERTTSLLNVMLDGYLSDQEKQLQLTRKLGSLIASLAGVFFVVVITILATISPLLVYQKLNGQSWDQLDTSSFIFYLTLSVGSIVPFVVHSKMTPKSDYTEWSKLLHRIVLNNNNLSAWLFQVEKKLFLPGKANETPDSLIITGLSRAGTTALTTILYHSEQFYSLSYANMPFLLSPNLWGKVYRPVQVDLKERSHGDKVMFGYNTVEAFEEHFWKVFVRVPYIENGYQKEHTIDSLTYGQYLQYQKLIQKYNGGNIYLAKNNNFMLRYKSLRKFNRNFMVLVMFRHPLGHAGSLLKQHRRYKLLQKDDQFVTEYMGWLGHYEFGSDHKRLLFQGSQLTVPFDQDSIDYWIALWIDYYKNILNLPEDEKLAIVDYQDFLQYPEPTINAIKQKFNIAFETGPLHKFDNPSESLVVDDELKAEAIDIHQRLLSRKLQVQR